MHVVIYGNLQCRLSIASLGGVYNTTGHFKHYESIMDHNMPGYHNVDIATQDTWCVPTH